MRSETEARALDAADELAAFRDEFLFPIAPDGGPALYFAGQSLGLQPRATKAVVDARLDAWARDAVEGHFRPEAWADADVALQAPMARLVGARPTEVAIANTLSVNLHLLLASFYRPAGARTVVLVDSPTFPSTATPSIPTSPTTAWTRTPT